jgi:hypothetical protein
LSPALAFPLENSSRFLIIRRLALLSPYFSDYYSGVK